MHQQDRTQNDALQIWLVIIAQQCTCNQLLVTLKQVSSLPIYVQQFPCLPHTASTSITFQYESNFKILSNSRTVVTTDGTSIGSFFQYWNYLGSHTTAELHKNIREMKHRCPFFGEEQKLVENIDSNLNSIFKKKNAE